MTLHRGSAVVLVLLGFVGAARAQEATQPRENAYPTSLIARPLNVPPGQLRVAATFGIEGIAPSGPPMTYPGGPGMPTVVAVPFGRTAYSAMAGIDFGVAEKLQLGANFDSPSIDRRIFRAIVDAQYRLAPLVSLHLDAGALFVWSEKGWASGVTLGLGAPFKWSLGHRLALISGRPYVWSSSDDWVVWNSLDGGSFGSLGLPLGLLAQLHDHVAVALRSGARRTFGNDPSGADRWFVPLAVDAIIGTRVVDFGATFELPGDLSAYGDRKQVLFWTAFRT